MSAMTQIPEHFVTEFDTNWTNVAQQRISKLKDRVVVEGNIQGKEKSYNQLGTSDFQKKTTRAADTRITDTPTGKRWLRPETHDKADLLDEDDADNLGSVILPTSNLMTNHEMAYGRLLDKTIITAGLGDAATGEKGETIVALPNSQLVPVNFGGSNSGLTVEKLIEIMFRFSDANIPEEDPKFIAVSARQIADLLAQTKVTSSDYNTVRALMTGEVSTYMGLTFVRTDKTFFPYNAGTDIRTVMAWARSGITLGDRGCQGKITIRGDKSDSIQVRSVARVGATRNEEVKVVGVLCDESP